MSGVLRLLLPYRRLELTTRLAPAQIVAALEREARAPTWLGALVGVAADGSVLKFYGRWDETSFDLRRVVAGRRSFTPRIRGTIAAAPNGSVIRVTMTPSGPGWLFLAAWCAGIAFCAVSYARQGAAASSLPELMVVTSGLLAAGLAFAYEARKARRLLLNVFKTTTWHSR